MKRSFAQLDACVGVLIAISALVLGVRGPWLVLPLGVALGFMLSSISRGRSTAHERVAEP